MSHHPPDTRPSYSSDQDFQSLPQVRVVLRHAPNHSLIEVIKTVMEFTHFGREEATHRMWQSHHCGQSLLMTTYVERAEWLVEQFAGRGLQVVLERA